MTTKPEKMTAEHLKFRLDGLRLAGGGRTADALESHIAALEAERDAYRDSLMEAARFEMEWASKDGNSPGYNNAKARNYGKQANEYRLRAEQSERERDAIRERVKALEKEFARLNDACGRWSDRHERLESRFAAIRQRAGDDAALIRRAEVGAIMGAASTDWDEELHSEVVQRGDAETLRGAALAVASYILGPDATESAARSIPILPVDEEDDRAMAELIAARPKTAPEPTTAEAFATVRSGLNVAAGASKYPTSKMTVEAAESDLSLLERRMGAMEMALTPFEGMAALLVQMRPGAGDDEVIRRTPIGGDSWHVLTMGDCRRLVAALIGAPAVFTLEEIRSVVRRLGPLSEEWAMGALSALRDATPGGTKR